MVGPAQQLQQILDREGIDPSRYEIVDAEKYIRNSDPPTCVFGGCDDTSMVMAYQRLKQDSDCSALLSAGNTGALLVGSICRLGLLPGLKFPALISALPCNGENLLCLVDCGANTECTANDLTLFARMGNVFAQSYCGIAAPRVGLMSVGREAEKGTPLIRQAHEQISALGLNFVGNVEGSDLVSGYADVIVTDGFSGNLLLKCAESVGKAAIVGNDHKLTIGRNDKETYSFTGTLTDGNGLTAELLQQNGITVYTEDEIGNIINDIDVDVVVTTPSANVVPSNTEVIRCGTITINGTIWDGD